MGYRGQLNADNCAVLAGLECGVSLRSSQSLRHLHGLAQCALTIAETQRRLAISRRIINEWWQATNREATLPTFSKETARHTGSGGAPK